ncbi:hypothetical protein AAC387_Pa01g0347 [Persea americana]
MARATLPPGVRFHPTDVELLLYYLKRKVLGKPLPFDVISEIEISKYSPWDLKDKSCLKSRDLEWHFFCRRDRKYASGSRANRATIGGYWKTTGKDRNILNNSKLVGTKKTLVYHHGKAPQGTRTDWVMYEYRLQDSDLEDKGISQDRYVVCKIFEKRGRGPRRGEPLGASFVEEEWDDDETNGSFVLYPFANPSSSKPPNPQTKLLFPEERRSLAAREDGSSLEHVNPTILLQELSNNHGRALVSCRRGMEKLESIIPNPQGHIQGGAVLGGDKNFYGLKDNETYQLFFPSGIPTTLPMPTNLQNLGITNLSVNLKKYRDHVMGHFLENGEADDSSPERSNPRVLIEELNDRGDDVDEGSNYINCNNLNFFPLFEDFGGFHNNVIGSKFNENFSTQWNIPSFVCPIGNTLELIKA